MFTKDMVDRMTLWKSLWMLGTVQMWICGWYILLGGEFAGLALIVIPSLANLIAHAIREGG